MEIFGERLVFSLIVAVANIVFLCFYTFLVVPASCQIPPIKDVNFTVMPVHIDWIPPISIWAELKFPQIPEKPSSRKPVPEPFDAKKLNVKVSADGFVVGQKFCQCGRKPWRTNDKRLNFDDNGPSSNDIPWTATLVLDKIGSPTVFCGGTLINDQHIVTASHCVVGMKPENISVRITEDDNLPSSSTIYQTHKFDVAKIIIHPKYNPTTIENDIALLELTEPIDFFEIPISPACLPIQNDIYYSKYNATVTRWVRVLDSTSGTSVHSESNALQKANLELISVDKCNHSNVLYQGLISENHICTKSCQGDSGGQLIIERNERKHLVGVGSWGLHCIIESSPSVYTRVAMYAGWILRNTKSAEWCIE